METFETGAVGNENIESGPASQPEIFFSVDETDEDSFEEIQSDFSREVVPESAQNCATPNFDLDFPEEGSEDDEYDG